MKQILPAAAALLISSVLAQNLCAEEKNGLSVNVTKRTLNRSDIRDSSSYTSYNRTQGYKLNIKNISMKPFAEGEVTWTILVRKANNERIEKYAGTEPLKSLRSSEAVEMMIGAVPIGGYRTYRENSKDDMDYELVVAHGGKETIRMSSMTNFAALARHAIDNEEGHGRGKFGRNAEDDVAPLTPAKPGGPEVAAIPGAPGAPSTPAIPGAPMTPGSPAAAPLPVAAPPSPAPAETAVAAPMQSFDFFNLKKKAPEAK